MICSYDRLGRFLQSRSKEKIALLKILECKYGQSAAIVRVLRTALGEPTKTQVPF